MTEDELLHSCELDLSSPQDERVYATMKEEVLEGLRRLRTINAQRNPSLGRTTSFDVSYNNEAEVLNEIRRIYAEASPSTRQVYDRADYVQSVQEENWIIRALLWILSAQYVNAIGNGVEG